MNDDRARGFPAFPARGGRARRAGSWWGNTWIQAMEDTALDVEQLRRGRRYAASGKVGPITVSPGRIAATVHGAEPYATQVLLDPLTEVEWQRFADRVAGRAGHIAALLDRDMPHDLVEAAEDAGVRLLPGIGDLEPECTCDGWELPCRHAAALCYQVAWLLDADPFVLLLIRGRGERELLGELQRRNASISESGRPGGGLTLPGFEGLDVEALEFLVADAAVRAQALLDGVEPAELGVREDAVRLGVRADAGIATRLREAVGSASEYERAVRAWEHGGAAALAVLEEPWQPAEAELAPARAALAEAWDGEPETSRNRCTLAEREAQLRYGRDGRWYPYRRSAGSWWPAGPPDADPRNALAELLA